MFALDHVHYSRLLPIHNQYMMSLSTKRPEILDEFNTGRFCCTQDFQQWLLNNATSRMMQQLKSWGIIGLTTYSCVLRHWMVAGRELLKL